MDFETIIQDACKIYTSVCGSSLDEKAAKDIILSLIHI